PRARPRLRRRAPRGGRLGALGRRPARGFGAIAVRGRGRRGAGRGREAQHGARRQVDRHEVGVERAELRRRHPVSPRDPVQRLAVGDAVGAGPPGRRRAARRRGVARGGARGGGGIGRVGGGAAGAAGGRGGGGGRGGFGRLARVRGRLGNGGGGARAVGRGGQARGAAAG